MKHVGTYRRVLPVTVERLYENALDWAHLPYVHRDSFVSIERLAADGDSWRARVRSVGGEETFDIELELDRASRRWITRTLSGRNQGCEVWTHAFPIERRRTDIVVDFFTSDIPDEQGAKLGRAFVDLYRRLYDQDEAMMLVRQRMLDTRIDTVRAPRAKALGALDELQLPLVSEWNGKPFVIARIDTRLVAYSARCPHMLGPLADGTVAGRVVECPWHGYRFDVTTGMCTSGHTYHLPPAPVVSVDAEGRVTLRCP